MSKCIRDIRLPFRASDSSASGLPGLPGFSRRLAHRHCLIASIKYHMYCLFHWRFAFFCLYTLLFLYNFRHCLILFYFLHKYKPCFLCILSILFSLPSLPCFQCLARLRFKALFLRSLGFLRFSRIRYHNQLNSLVRFPVALYGNCGLFSYSHLV